MLARWRSLPTRERRAVARTLAVGVAVAALLAGARAGTPRVGLLVLLVVYVGAAAVWVRGQYVDSLDGRPWLLPWRWVVVLAAAGTLSLVLYAVAGRDGAALTGAILLYFALGAAVARWRDTPRRRRWLGLGGVGLALLVSAVVVGAVGAAVLGRVGDGFGVLPLVLLGAGALLLGPVSLALLSEDAITSLTDRGPPGSTRRRLVGLSGLGAAVLFAALAVVWSDSPIAFGAVVVLALLVVALVSSTQADIAAILGTLALLGVTPAQTPLPQALADVGGRDQVLVALGDSYMSGEGADVYFEGTDDGGRNMCRRAPTAWAAKAGQRPPFDGALFLACSGASTYNVRTEPTPRPVPRAQLGEGRPQLGRYREARARAPFDAELVVLTIGGNDAGFATIGVMCLAPGSCDERASLWLDGLDQVERALRATYAEVRRAFPDTPVVVVPYPQPIADADRPCSQVSLTRGERTFLRRFVAGLDERMRRAAAAEGIHYLAEMESSLADAHLQLCDPLNGGRPGVNFIGLRSVNGIAEQRFNPANWVHNSLHPNERGHEAMLRTFESWLAGHRPLTESPAAVAPAPSPGAGPPAQCDLFDDSSLGCRTQGITWVAQQTGAFVLKAGLVGVPLILAVVAAASSFFAARRRSGALSARRR